VRSKHFSWKSQLNLTRSRNALVAFPGLALSPYAQTYVIGQPIDIHKVFASTGVDPTTGVYGFKDAKGDPTFTPAYAADKTTLVNTDPRFYGGFQNSFTYKGFQLDILFQFVKQNGLNPMFQPFTPPGYTGTNRPQALLDRWQTPGDLKPYQKYTEAYGSAAWNAYSYAQQSTLYYTDASFIRLKNLALSWDLPHDWLIKLHIQGIRLYLHGQNLLTFTKYKGIDPETQSLTSLPPLRVVVGGIQVTL
jgi:hypothetical protein